MKKKFILAGALFSIIALSSCSIFGLDSKSQDVSYSSSTEGYEYVKSKYTYKDYAKYNAYRTDFCPSVGNPKLLVIPVWFTDSGSYITSDKKESVRDDIRKAYKGSEEETGWQSVCSFYKTESRNKCFLDATISEWYECGDKSSVYYRSTDMTSSLVTKAENWYFDNHKEDSRTNYDSDHNGYLDGVMLIYASPDYASLQNDNAKNMWAYCNWITGRSGTAAYPITNAYFWASYDFMYSSGRRALLKTGSTYGHGDNSNCEVDAHTYIHEMGHVFGLEDYYDYSDAQYCPAGGLSMQDYNVCGHEPFSTIALGWTDPMVIRNSTTIELNAFQKNHDVALLSPNYTGSPFDEYILVELYTPDGLNKFDCDHRYETFPNGLSNTGIRIWHVDARLAYYKYSPTLDDWTIDPNDIDIVPNKGNQAYCIGAFKNTYAGSEYASNLGQFNSKYYNYNLLQLIRNNQIDNIYNTAYMKNQDMFYSGNSFTLSSFQKQFVENNKLNKGVALNWTISINSIRDGKANITFTKA